MDKVTTIAFLLYKSSKNQDIRDKAIELLNGDVTVRDLKRYEWLQAHFAIIESQLKKNQIDKLQVQRFVEEFMTVEV